MIERINLLLKAKNITARQFAEEIGIQPSGMSHILSGRNNPSLDFVMKVVKRWPEVNISWLMFGTGEMYAGTPINIPSPAPSPLNVDSKNDAPPLELEDEVGYDLFSQPDVPIASPSKKQEDPVGVSSPIAMPAPIGENVSHADTRLSNHEELPSIGMGIKKPVQQVVERVQSQLNESGLNENVQPSVLKKSILERKRIVKMIVLYDDHTFSEYFPE